MNVRSNAHTALIRTIGGASAVLLKNVNNTLPLLAPGKIAVIGLDAGPNAGCNLNACDAGTLSVGCVLNLCRGRMISGWTVYLIGSLNVV